MTCMQGTSILLASMVIPSYWLSQPGQGSQTGCRHFRFPEWPKPTALLTLAFHNLSSTHVVVSSFVRHNTYGCVQILGRSMAEHVSRKRHGTECVFHVRFHLHVTLKHHNLPHLIIRGVHRSRAAVALVLLRLRTTGSCRTQNILIIVRLRQTCRCGDHTMFFSVGFDRKIKPKHKNTSGPQWHRRFQ